MRDYKTMQVKGKPLRIRPHPLKKNEQRFQWLSIESEIDFQVESRQVTCLLKIRALRRAKQNPELLQHIAYNVWF